MSCVDFLTTDWRSLVAQRDESGENPADWDAAMAHIDACDPCRREALMADPSLVFRRLPRVESSAAEVESMRQAVASLRRASRVTAVEADVARAEPALRPRVRARLRHAAAAVLLTVAGLGAWMAGPTLLGYGDAGSAAEAVATKVSMSDAALAPDPVPASDLTSPSPFLIMPLAAGDSLAAFGGSPSSRLPSRLPSRLSAEDLAARPVFEELSQPRAADVYQVGEEDLLVVMVVDETLDI